MPTRNPYSVILVFVAIAVLLGGLGVAYQAQAYEHDRTNVETTVDYDTNTTLGPNRALSYSDTINVTVNGSELNASDDYHWNATTGVINWQNTTATNDSDTVFVDYQFQAVSQATEDRKRVLSQLASLAPYFALALGIGATWALVDGGGL
jgi:hypothetical protein